MSRIYGRTTEFDVTRHITVIQATSASWANALFFPTPSSTRKNKIRPTLYPIPDVVPDTATPWMLRAAATSLPVYHLGPVDFVLGSNRPYYTGPIIFVHRSREDRAQQCRTWYNAHQA